tara:strand:- start:51 stop:455 length:405 start_codon:yes stop_codon:yes gene_type:complete
MEESTLPKKTTFTASDMAKGRMNEVFRTAMYVPVKLKHRSFGDMHLINDEWTSGIIRVFNNFGAPIMITQHNKGVYAVERLGTARLVPMMRLGDNGPEYYEADLSTSTQLIGEYDNPLLAISYALEAYSAELQD